MSQHKPKATIWSRYGFFWFTFALFVLSFAGHWILAWFAFVSEQAEHAQAAAVGDFLVQTGRDTLENWQSEFLQLIWQVSGLALLFHIGSPQSNDGNDRLEEKVDLILKSVSEDADEQIAHLDGVYQRD